MEQKTKRSWLWKPGQSGNPNGRPPKERCLTHLLITELDKVAPEEATRNLPSWLRGRTWRELVIYATLGLAIKGNYGALREVWDRTDGKIADGMQDMAVKLIVSYVNTAETNASSERD